MGDLGFEPKQSGTKAHVTTTPFARSFSKVLGPLGFITEGRRASGRRHLTVSHFLISPKLFSRLGKSYTLSRVTLQKGEGCGLPEDRHQI